MTPLEKMIYEAIRFANWAAGEGFCPENGEPANDPADILYEFSMAHDVDDWDELPDLVIKMLRA